MKQQTQPIQMTFKDKVKSMLADRMKKNKGKKMGKSMLPAMKKLEFTGD